MNDFRDGWNEPVDRRSRSYRVGKWIGYNLPYVMMAVGICWMFWALSHL